MQPKVQFKCIIIPLNHRLIRKLKWLIEWYVKECWGCVDKHENIMIIYKYIKRMWKHKNTKRRSRDWRRTFWNKKPNKRFLYLYTNWAFYISNDNYSNYTLKKWDIKIEDLFKWITSAIERVPF